MKLLMIALSVFIPAQCTFAQAPAAGPTKEHELLNRNLGDRTGTMKMWASPDADPIEIPVKETNTLVLGGLWVQTELIAGPYQGRGMTGYDPAKKKYIGIWTNNQTPHLTVMEGTNNAKTHELTMLFRDLDPATGDMVDMKSVTSSVPGKPESFTMYARDAASGKWVKSFVMTYDEK